MNEPEKKTSSTATIYLYLRMKDIDNTDGPTTEIYVVL